MGTNLHGFLTGCQPDRYQTESIIAVGESHMGEVLGGTHVWLKTRVIILGGQPAEDFFCICPGAGLYNRDCMSGPSFLLFYCS